MPALFVFLQADRPRGVVTHITTSSVTLRLQCPRSAALTAVLMSHRAEPASLVTQSVAGFLKDVPPFVLLPEDERREMTHHVSLEFFPRDTVILKAGGEPSESLYVIYKGAVRLTLANDAGDNVLLDVRGEGDLFGVLSLIGGDTARFDVTAMEDTLAYSIPAGRVHELTQRFP